MSSSLASQLALAAAAAPGVRAGTASAPTKGRPSLLFHAREAEDVDARTVLALARSGALSRARVLQGFSPWHQWHVLHGCFGGALFSCSFVGVTLCPWSRIGGTRIRGRGELWRRRGGR
jgi:hypothetical protein